MFIISWIINSAFLFDYLKPKIFKWLLNAIVFHLFSSYCNEEIALKKVKMRKMAINSSQFIREIQKYTLQRAGFNITC